MQDRYAPLGEALSAGYTAVAAEAYYSLAITLHHSEQYEGTVDAFQQASEFCKDEGLADPSLKSVLPLLQHVQLSHRVLTERRAAVGSLGH